MKNWFLDKLFPNMYDIMWCVPHVSRPWIRHEYCQTKRTLVKNQEDQKTIVQRAGYSNCTAGRPKPKNRGQVNNTARNVSRSWPRRRCPCGCSADTSMCRMGGCSVRLRDWRPQTQKRPQRVIVRRGAVINRTSALRIATSSRRRRAWRWIRANTRTTSVGARKWSSWPDQLQNLVQGEKHNPEHGLDGRSQRRAPGRKLEDVSFGFHLNSVSGVSQNTSMSNIQVLERWVCREGLGTCVKRGRWR